MRRSQSIRFQAILFGLLVAFAPLPARAATISAPSPIAPGAITTVTVSGGPGNAADWVGLFQVGGSSPVSWLYLNGSQAPPSSGSSSATLTFKMPTGAGAYEFRLFADDTWTLVAASQPVTVALPSPFVSDTFSGANGTLLANHAPDLSATGARWTTSSSAVMLNAQRAVTNVRTFATATIDTGIADGTVSVDWTSSAWGGSGGLMFRGSDANNYWLASYSDPTCELDKVINGVVRRATSLNASDDLTQPPMSDRLSVTLAGASIRFSCAGHVLQTTDPFNVTGTRSGLEWYAGDGTAAFDNFQTVGFPLPPVAGVVIAPGPVTVPFKRSQVLTAQAYNAAGGPLWGVSFGWSSSNPAAVTVTALTATTATVSAVGPGAATISATPVLGTPGNTTVTVDPGAYLVFDDFNGPNGTGLAARAPLLSQIASLWTTNNAAVTLNDGRSVTGSRVSAIATIDGGAADGTVSAEWTSAAWGGSGGLVFRASDANNYWLAGRYDPQCWLGKYVNGRWITLQTVSISDDLNQPPLSDTLSVSLGGSSVTFACAGVVLKATDPFNATATKYGLEWESGDGTASFDNFQITGSLPPGPSRVAVTPAPASLTFGASATLSAQAFDSSGHAMPGVSVAWTTSNPTAVRVTPLSGSTALVTGDAVGTATITATPLRGASGSAEVTVTPGSYLVYDRFSGADGTALTAHAPNVDQIGAGWFATRVPAPALSGGTVRLSSGTADADAVIDAGTPNATVTVGWTAGLHPSGGANYGALIFRRSDANNYFILEYWNRRVTIARVMKGARTTLWSDEAEVDPGQTHKLQAILSGSSIEVQWDDGVLLRDLSDTFNLSATQYGFRFSPYWDQNAAYDDFSVAGTLPPVPDHVVVALRSVGMPFGTAQNVTAQAFDVNNVVIPGVSFGWTTSNAMIARVGPMGPALASVVATGTGTATITATPSRGPGASVSVTVTPGQTIVYDSFTDTEGTLLTAHQPEVNPVGHGWTVAGAPAASVVGGYAARPAVGIGDVSAFIDAATPDAVVNVSWTAGLHPAGGANYGGLIFRQSDPRNYFLLEYWSGRVSLYRVMNAAFTRLWSDEALVDPGETHRFRATLKGPDIEVMWDEGVLSRSVRDPFNMSASAYGFVLAGWDTAATYDDFWITGTLPPPIQTLAASVAMLTMAPFDTQELSTLATDASGRPVTGAFVQWTSSNAATATVAIDSSTMAKIEALAEGSTIVTAHAPIGPAPDLTIPVTVSICTGNLAPSSISIDWLGGTKSLVVTAPAACNWTAWSRVPWISVVAGESGSGTRMIIYTIEENDSIPRTGTVVIGGRLLTISQDSRPCSYSMWPESAHWGASGGSGGFDVWTSGDCRWDAMVTQPAGFLTAAGSAVGFGTVTYSLDPNPSLYPRRNTIHIGTAIFVVTQEDASVPGGDLGAGAPPPCQYAVMPTGVNVPIDGASVNLDVSAAGTCAWLASTDVPWIAISPFNGIGSGRVTLAVAASPSARVGHVTIADQAITVSQGSTCTYTLSQPNNSTPGLGVFSITTQSGCVWTVTSDVPWLTVLTAGSGTGSISTVAYAIAVNSSNVSAIGHIAIREAHKRLTIRRPANVMRKLVAGGDFSDGLPDECSQYTALVGGVRTAWVGYCDAEYLTCDEDPGNDPFPCDPHMDSPRSGILFITRANDTIEMELDTPYRGTLKVTLVVAGSSHEQELSIRDGITGGTYVFANWRARVPPAPYIAVRAEFQKADQNPIGDWRYLTDVPQVSVGVDLEANDVAVVTSGAEAGLLTVKISGFAEDDRTLVDVAGFPGGSSRSYELVVATELVGADEHHYRMPLQDLPVGALNKVTASWQPAPQDASVSLNGYVLGFMNHTKYNTPDEAECAKVDSDVSTYSVEATPYQCDNFEDVFNALFVKQFDQNANGRALKWGLRQKTWTVCRNTEAMRSVPEIRGAPAYRNGPTAVLTDSSLAMKLNAQTGTSVDGRVKWGDKILMVADSRDQSSSVVGTVQDSCNGCEVDHYTPQIPVCRVRDNPALGSYGKRQTIRLR